MNPKYIRNRIRCLNCNEIIESKYRHDYRSCNCGLVSVDGGLDYLRRGYPSGKPAQWYEELSEQTKIPQGITPFGQASGLKTGRRKESKLSDFMREDL